MNTNVKPVIEFLRVTVKPSAQVAPNCVLTVVSHQGEVIVQRRFITMPMVLLSEVQWQTFRALSGDEELAWWMDRVNRRVDDQIFENLIEESYKEDKKWDEGPREDLYLGC